MRKNDNKRLASAEKKQRSAGALVAVNQNTYEHRNENSYKTYARSTNHNNTSHRYSKHSSSFLAQLCAQYDPVQTIKKERSERRERGLNIYRQNTTRKKSKPSRSFGTECNFKI